MHIGSTQCGVAALSRWMPRTRVSRVYCVVTRKLLYIRDIEETAPSYEGALFLTAVLEGLTALAGRQYDAIHHCDSAHNSPYKVARFTTGLTVHHSMDAHTSRVAMRAPRVATYSYLYAEVIVYLVTLLMCARW
jgi:hypothetical protein